MLTQVGSYPTLNVNDLGNPFFHRQRHFFDSVLKDFVGFFYTQRWLISFKKAYIWRWQVFFKNSNYKLYIALYDNFTTNRFKESIKYANRKFTERQLEFNKRLDVGSDDMEGYTIVNTLCYPFDFIDGFRRTGKKDLGKPYVEEISDIELDGEIIFSYKGGILYVPDIAYREGKLASLYLREKGIDVVINTPVCSRTFNSVKLILPISRKGKLD